MRVKNIRNVKFNDQIFKFYTKKEEEKYKKFEEFFSKLI